MSILIKGMVMPNKCEECPLFNGDLGGCGVTRYFILRKWGKGKPDWCPLVEVPTPHGRLIDADRLPICREYSDGYESYVVYEEDLNAAPTVIEAEEQHDGEIRRY